MSKDLWFAEFERLYNEAEEHGPVTDKVYDGLATKADHALRERLADKIDELRLRMKEGR